MRVPLYILTLAHLIRAAAIGTERPGSGRRTCRLYCRVGIGFHLQIHPDGRVNGSHEADHLSIVELFAMSQGVVGIRGVSSSRFLAMNHRGRLHATEGFSEDCVFRESFQKDGYNTFSSVVHRGPRTARPWLVALNKRGRAKMGSSPRVKTQHVSAHFLPRATQQHYEEHGFKPYKTPQPLPMSKVRAPAGSRQKVAQVKYWPKYRWG
ncbi:Fibroblast growth factor 5 [Merluccius polli]|uniref:Fibroblast growth factor n=1 Tax=Merluccius polli TaxID=89951 RepID=A0AA47M8J1_MERPO|nr:Fibroblast growth factor 5 [Merluccius polli]